MVKREIKHSIQRLTVLLMLLDVASFQAEQAQASSQEHTIQGIVLDAETEEPLFGVRITLKGDTAPQEFPMCGLGGCRFPAQRPGTLAFTDQTGHFTLPELDDPSFKLSAERNGYQSSFTDFSKIKDAESLQSLRFRMVPSHSITGTVSGHVHDRKTGGPAANVPVSLLRRTYTRDGREALEPAGSTETNDLGEYRLFGVKPGRYYAVFGATPREFRLRQAIQSNLVHIPFGRTFFPGVRSTADASAIEIKAGSDRSGIDITLDRVRVYQIKGYVVDSRTGLPPKDAMVMANLYDTGSLTWLYPSQYDPQTGAFEITVRLNNSWVKAVAQ